MSLRGCLAECLNDAGNYEQALELAEVSAAYNREHGPIARQADLLLKRFICPAPQACAQEQFTGLSFPALADGRGVLRQRDKCRDREHNRNKTKQLMRTASRESSLEPQEKNSWLEMLRRLKPRTAPHMEVRDVTEARTGRIPHCSHNQPGRSSGDADAPCHRYAFRCAGIRLGQSGDGEWRKAPAQDGPRHRVYRRYCADDSSPSAR